MQRIQQTMRLLLLALSLATAGVSITACNTADGFGKDMEEAGEEIQEETDDDGVDDDRDGKIDD